MSKAATMKASPHIFMKIPVCAVGCAPTFTDKTGHDDGGVSDVLVPVKQGLFSPTVT